MKFKFVILGFVIGFPVDQLLDARDRVELIRGLDIDSGNIVLRKSTSGLEQGFSIDALLLSQSVILRFEGVNKSFHGIFQKCILGLSCQLILLNFCLHREHQGV